MIFDFAPRVGLSAKSAAILTNDLRLIFGFVDLSTESLQLATMQLRCHPSVARTKQRSLLEDGKKHVRFHAWCSADQAAAIQTDSYHVTHQNLIVLQVLQIGKHDHIICHV